MAYGDIRPRDILVSLVIFGLVITGGVSLIGRFLVYQPSYADDQYTEFNETFNKLEETQAKTTELKNSLVSQNLPQPLDFLANMYLTAYQTAMSLFSGFEFIDAIFNGLSTIFGIPTWAIAGILSLITIIFTFGALSAFLARDL
jgi:hypothetical protein